MPYTTLRRFSVQTAGSNSGTWGAGGTTGDDLNTGGFGPLDSMLAGISTISTTSGTYSLTFTAGGGGDVQNAIWRFTATLLGNLTVVPTAGNATTYLTGAYYWENLTSGSYTITVTTGTGSVVLPQGRRGTLFFDAVNAPRITSIAGSSTADPLPGNGTTSVLFKMASPPSGWTQVVSLNNYALRLVSGTGAGTGGSTGFTSVFTSRTPAGSVSAPTVDIPPTGYSQVGSVTSVAGNIVVGSGSGTYAAALAQMNATRTLTASAPSFTGTAMDFAVTYVDLINATRD